MQWGCVGLVGAGRADPQPARMAAPPASGKASSLDRDPGLAGLEGLAGLAGALALGLQA